MYGGLTMAERVDLDFARARRRAFIARLTRRFRSERTEIALLDFEEAGRGLAGGRRLGRRVVEVARIVGSVGRSGDFDGSFMPKTARLREKWEHVDREFHRGEADRAVSLYKVGGDYYVSDGNHRVSVARFHGVEMIDADVVEFRPIKNGDPKEDHPPRRKKPAMAGRA